MYAIRSYYAKNKTATFTNNVVLSIAPDNDGTLWIGTYEAGLCKLNPKTMSFIKLQKSLFNIKIV